MNRPNRPASRARKWGRRPPPDGPGRKRSGNAVFRFEAPRLE
ncbi:MAG: hypothetical protein OZSIB_1291 [Candidatus Ozemobacter sibiricus]|uniref:Uncharacterized protein n=1 Tax=Candidatus Ozemobacter sibiricus TaxID=2268124 RepID=A0A367ZLC4_9BACT|nr:MAG: hypothetical protein OZSIB_1291 [Candidatus Ozemobacter sibiricus]